MQFYINLNAQFKGGPHLWSRRFYHALEKRGYQVTQNLEDDWIAALFINRSDDMNSALRKNHPVGYRVAGIYNPIWFERLGYEMKPVHHAANAAITRALEIADKVVYQSQWAKSELDSFLYRRTNNYSIIYNGVDLKQFTPPITPPPGPPVLGTVGVLRHRYRLWTFLEMSRRLDIDHRLLIVGELDTDCKEVIYQYQMHPIVGPRINYLSHVPQSKLPSIYQKMSLLIHPICGDVCPNVVVEALACGLPVVTPRIGGTAELVENAGKIFDCNPWVYDEHFIDAMTDATANAIAEVDRFSLLARQQAEKHFNSSHMVDQYLESLGLSHFVSKPLPSNYNWQHFIRQLISRLILKPRFYTALALRRSRQATRKLIPPTQNIKPRIAFTLYDFHVGGIENWLYRLAYELRDQFEFYFISTTVSDFLPKFRTIGSCAYLPSASNMISFLQKYNIDIVQVHNERWPIDAALAAGVPHIIERTDGTRSCTRIPKQGLSLVIASSKGTVPLIAQKFPEEKIIVIYNGIDLNYVDTAHIERPWTPQSFVIGRTSRFGRGKNLSLLIEAMYKLHPRFPQVQLVLIGGDSLMPGAEAMEIELKKMAKSLGEAIQFVGVKEDTIPWIKGFDVGTCVSNPDNEGIPNSLIEAMACSKPIISTDVDQVTELVEDNVNGLLIPPGDVDALCQAIEKLMINPFLCNRMGQAGRKTIEERFSVQMAANQYSNMYHQLLGY